MKDYSQYGQQQFLADYFKGRTGFLVDIGASDGILFSNSRHLLENGWKGLLIEPNPMTFARLVAQTLGIVDAVPVNVACLDQFGLGYLSVPPLEKDIWGTEGTLRDVNKEGWTQYRVPVFPLGKLWARKFDLLLVDAEGADLSVLRGVDWGINAPELVVTESLYSDRENLDDYMKEVGYRVLERGHIDTYYQRMNGDGNAR